MKLSEVKQKKILLSCLNWGMGHVARSIGLIRKLHDQNNTLIIAGNSDQLKVFRTYLPEIQTVEIDGYPFEFEKYRSFQEAIWKQKNKLWKFLNFERKWVDEKVKELEIDLVISDHRYGFRSKKVTSIFITHQIQLPLKGFYKFFQFFHSRWITHFNAVWIVDEVEKRLAGKLSVPTKVKNFEFIGHLSRFECKKEITENQRPDFSVLLVSGPVVHVNYLYDYYLSHSKKEFQKLIIGKSLTLASLPQEGNFTLLESSNWQEIDEILGQATEIFSFFGYSTLMDSKFLSAEFHLIPCLNQWEQEYLSTIHPKILNER
ncbi:MAG: hypothetical protein ACKO7D_07460 [Bacteroidota bacterium]